MNNKTEQLTLFDVHTEASEDKKLKRNWENAFQRWSNKENLDECSSFGKCGYGIMCDYCTDADKGRPCVRALIRYCKDKKLKIDYNNRNFEDIWQGNIN